MITYRSYGQLTPVCDNEENYHEVCHNYLSYSAISAIVSGKGSSGMQGNKTAII